MVVDAKALREVVAKRLLERLGVWVPIGVKVYIWRFTSGGLNLEVYIWRFTYGGLDLKVLDFEFRS